MSRARVMVMVLAGSAAAACAGARATPREGGTHVLRYATSYAPGHPFSRADRTWMNHVARASGGRLRIEPQCPVHCCRPTTP